MVYLLLAEGFEDVEAVAPIDILRRAGIPLLTVGVPNRRLTSKHGLTVEADSALKEIITVDLEMLVLPGGPGVARLKANPGVYSLVTATARLGKPIGAICAAPGLLAEWGLLNGRKAVCFPSCEEELTRNGALLDSSQQVITDSPFVTAKAAGASVDFALALVALLRGQQAADTVSERFHARV